MSWKPPSQAENATPTDAVYVQTRNIFIRLTVVFLKRPPHFCPLELTPQRSPALPDPESEVKNGVPCLSGGTDGTGHLASGCC